MYDDGAHGDGAAGDHVYGATIPAQAVGTTVSYYVSATDDVGLTTTDPAPAHQAGPPPIRSRPTPEPPTISNTVQFTGHGHSHVRRWENLLPRDRHRARCRRSIWCTTRAQGEVSVPMTNTVH